MTALAPWPPERPSDWWMLLLLALLVATITLAGLTLAYGLSTA